MNWKRSSAWHEKVQSRCDRRSSEDLRGKLAYIRKKLRNPQAVKNVYADYKLTRKELEEVAGTIHEPDSEVLKLRKLKRINFRSHNYFMLFRLNDDRVEITNIFHDSEDFENKFV